MKFIIHRNMLETSLHRVLSAVSSAEMAHIGLRVRGETLDVMMQDTVMSAYAQTPCLPEQEGTAFVPAKLFSDVVRELPDMDIQVAIEGSRCLVKAGESIELKLPVRADIQWCEPPELSESYKFQIPAVKLHYLIEQVNPCLDPKSNRSYATVGFLKQESPGVLRLVGTNGFRLSFAETKFDLDQSVLTGGVCLTRKALTEVYRMCGEGFEYVEMNVSDSDKQISVSVPGYQLFIKLSTVSYPHYQSVIPKKEGFRYAMERKSFMAVIRRVLLAAGKSRGLHVAVDKGWMTLQTRDAGSSEGREIVPLSNPIEKHVAFAVNGAYLSDILSTVSCESVSIVTHAGDEPIVVLPELEPSGCVSQHMLMQIQEDYADNHGERND